MKNLIYLIVGIVIIAVAAFLIVGGGDSTVVERNPYADYFESELQRIGLERVGQPIEGFDASILMTAFPGLEEVDFDGVQTAQGSYSYEAGELTFENTATGAIHSAERMISSEGYNTLLLNSSDRLGLEIETQSGVNQLISQIGEGFVDPNDKSDLIVVDEPEVDETIESPLTLKGEARGTWYFEATFPVVLTDWDGRIIGEGFVEAQDDWMTEEFVPFEGTLEFEVTEDAPEGLNYGFLIFQKANPSGLPENDDALEFRVQF